MPSSSSSFDPLSYLYLNFRYTLETAITETRPESLYLSPELLSCLTGLPHPFGNILLPGRVSDGEFHTLLKKGESWFREREVPVALAFFPNMGPSIRVEQALARGWITLDEMPGMWIRLGNEVEATPLSPEVDVRLIDNEDDLSAALEVLAEGYPIPMEIGAMLMRGIHLAGARSGGRFANFLATVGGRPAACSSVCVDDGVAGIYCVATLEPFRGQGLGSLVTRMAMEHGRRWGASHALLHATPMGTPVYKQIGFRTLCHIPLLGFGLG